MSYNSDIESEGDWLEEQVSDSSENNAEEILINEELGTAILNCLSKLPKKQREVFKMKTIQGFDTDVICNEFNITASNLWVIVHRARTTLANCLKENWF